MPDWGTVAGTLIRGGNNLPNWKGRKATLTLAELAKGLIALGLGGLARVTHGAEAVETTVGDCLWANKPHTGEKYWPPMTGLIIGPIAGSTIGHIPKERMSSTACW